MLSIAVEEISKAKENLVQYPQKKSKKSTKKSKSLSNDMPEIGKLIDKAFPMWEIDKEGKRVTPKSCTLDSYEWNLFYVTKRYDGRHPDFGGYPPDLDVKCAFFGASPFGGQPCGGQPCGGTPLHCEANFQRDPSKLFALNSEDLIWQI